MARREGRDFELLASLKTELLVLGFFALPPSHIFLFTILTQEHPYAKAMGLNICYWLVKDDAALPWGSVLVTFI